MRLFPPEVIGSPDCPLLHRWTLAKGRGRKLLLHHFMPDATDTRDHPWPFVTLVLRGGYEDMVRCEPCSGHGYRFGLFDWRETCRWCSGRGIEVGDRLRAGSIRFRDAEYAHNTRTDRRGAWTIVLARPKSRDLGFWCEGTWWPFKEYERIFGFVMRCEDR